MRLPLLACACLLLAAAAGGSPAMIAPGDAGAAQAEHSFHAFAESWMQRALARSSRDSKAPLAQPGARGVVFSYRGVAEDFETELRPTGRPSSPWIGVLHYTETTYSCRDPKGSGCQATSSLPVTEVFRYRDGRWGY